MQAHHDPDERADDEWATWFNGFICGLAVAGGIWLVLAWIRGACAPDQLVRQRQLAGIVERDKCCVLKIHDQFSLITGPPSARRKSPGRNRGGCSTQDSGLAMRM